jgi:hypothetical protein
MATDIVTAQNRSGLDTLNTGKKATAAALANGSRSAKLTTVQTGDASKVAFTIAHGLPAAPTQYYVTPRNAVSAALHFVTVDATNVTVTFLAAPPAAANNVTFVGYAAI